MSYKILMGNIEYLKRKNRLSQEKLGLKLKISIKTVGCWFEGRSEPQTQHLRKISIAFKVSIDYLCRKDISQIAPRKLLANFNTIQNYLRI